MLTAPGTQSADRRAAIEPGILAVVGALVLAAVIVYGDKLLQGPRAFERAHDGGDYFVTTLVGCGQFWRAPASALWDPSIARGWPALYGSFAPQYFGCLAAAVLPSHFVWPVIQIVLLATLAAGSFLFLRLGLGLAHEASYAGALLNVALFYWFHENDSQTSATLLIPLIGFLSVRDGLAARAVAFLGLAAVIMLSVPVGTLVLMPLTHLALIAVLPKAGRRRHLFAWVAFWTIYGLYYLPTLFAYLSHLAVSNRALFKADTLSPASFASLYAVKFDNTNVISPGLVLLAFVAARTRRATVIAIGAILALVAIAVSNQYLLRHFSDQRSWMVSASTTYYRLYYLVPTVVFLWGSRLLADAASDSRLAGHVRRLLGVGLFAATLGYYVTWRDPTFFSQFNQFALWIGAGLTGVLFLVARMRGFVVTCLLALVFIAPLRHWYTQNWESPLQGNLYLEDVSDDPRPEPFRTVTVMRTCDAADIFPAQAAIRGRETLDGVDNLYDRGFAEQWQFYVAQGSTGCTARYAGWNTRVEVTPEDFRREPDRIMSWFWINGVDEIRSFAPLEHPDLALNDSREFNVHWYGPVTRYRYRMNNPLTRVFAMPASASATPALEQEYQHLRDIKARGVVTPIPAEAYSGSRIAFSGSFDPATVIQASVNFQPGWTLYVDGVKASGRLVKGMFSMPAFAPLPGFHQYALTFQESGALLTIGCMLLSLAGLAITR